MLLLVFSLYLCSCLSPFFFFNDPTPTELYTLSLHDALPILRPTGLRRARPVHLRAPGAAPTRPARPARPARVSSRTRAQDRKSTRLNSSHLGISYAVFCLKKKKKKNRTHKTADDA